MNAERRDYYDDPAAPAPNRVEVRVFVVVIDPEDRLLCHQRDSGPWSLPGGGLEVGETIEECAVRETREETGVDIHDVRVATAVSWPWHVIVRDEGPDAHQQAAILVTARCGRDAVPRPSEESPVVRFVTSEEFDALPFDRAQRMFVELVAAREPWVPFGQ